VEREGGRAEIGFDDPARDVRISPNAPVKQLWISALSTSFKRDWSGCGQRLYSGEKGERMKALLLAN